MLQAPTPRPRTQGHDQQPRQQGIGAPPHATACGAFLGGVARTGSANPANPANPASSSSTNAATAPRTGSATTIRGCGRTIEI
ncbi:MAG: hypothetical protein OEW11_05210, partial [Nitrospirota bacterium]|nr:hypothetical protein [Nitrospirota bacterium]